MTQARVDPERQYLMDQGVLAARTRFGVLANAMHRAFPTLPETDGMPASTSTELPDGTLGYHSCRADDCFVVAVATVLQVTPREMPDLRLVADLRAGEDPDAISRRAWMQMERFAAGRGLRIRVCQARLPTHRSRWIGVCSPQRDKPFEDHCLVMSRDELLFDPAAWKHALLKIWSYGPEDITYGVTFDRQRKRGGTR